MANVYSNPVRLDIDSSVVKLSKSFAFEFEGEMHPHKDYIVLSGHIEMEEKLIRRVRAEIATLHSVAIAHFGSAYRSKNGYRIGVAITERVTQPPKDMESVMIYDGRMYATREFDLDGNRLIL